MIAITTGVCGCGRGGMLFDGACYWCHSRAKRPPMPLPPPTPTRPRRPRPSPARRESRDEVFHDEPA